MSKLTVSTHFCRILDLIRQEIQNTEKLTGSSVRLVTEVATEIKTESFPMSPLANHAIEFLRSQFK